MIAQVQKFSTAFAADTRGSIAPIFGLIFTVLLLSIGIAFDYSRLGHAGSKSRSAADAAALAAGKALLHGRNTDADVRAIAVKFFNENMSNGGQLGSTTTPVVIIDRATGSVKVEASTEVRMAIMTSQGGGSLTMPATSSVISDQQDIELGMALDVTGSMGGQKIADLRAAAKDLVDILIPDGGTANKVRIGLAPYAASVNAGNFAAPATNNASTKCVRERGGVEAFTDAMPEVGVFLGGLPNNACPTAKVEPLSDNKITLKASIDTYRASGATAGHLGAAWASYIISPKWKDIWPAASEPAAYNDGKTLKAIILMTDGEFNTQYVNSNGNSATQALRICQEAKNNDVVVYAVGFQSPTSAENMLKACASSSDTYFSASNGAELRQSFIEIAQQLNNLRVTQ